jgi:hypothetical protein
MDLGSHDKVPLRSISPATSEEHISLSIPHIDTPKTPQIQALQDMRLKQKQDAQRLEGRLQELEGDAHKLQKAVQPKQAETPSALTSAATAQQTHDGASKLHESPRTAPEPHGPETSANTAVEGPKAEPEPVAQEVAAEPAQDKEAPKATRKRWW